ncbi:MAG: 1-hydroxycarotenoid 3,4-desaturase CrtD [Pseudomonadota bacterium]
MNSVAQGHRVVVVGAGMAGLSAAIKLAGQGFHVTVVEKEASVGGKARHVMVDGQPIDGGPTVFTMKWAFDALLAPLGEKLEDHVNLRTADVLARHYWADGSSLDLFADIDRSVDAIRDFAGGSDAKGYRRFCEDSRAVFATLKDTYIAGQRPNPIELIQRIGVFNVTDMLRLKPFETLWSALDRYFDDTRLRQLFGRYATYCGSSPYKCPATLMLVAHVEQDGVWLPEGGMHGVARALRSIAEDLGVRFLTGQAVSKVAANAGHVASVRLADGNALSCDSVVFNGDLSALAAGQMGLSVSDLGVVPTEPEKRSLSAMVWSVVVPAGELPLAHHTVCFGDAYQAEFRSIFDEAAMPAQPTTYICAQDRDCDGTLKSDAAARGTERLLILTNAPARGDTNPEIFSDMEKEKCLHAMIAQLNRCGVHLQPDMLLASKLTSPKEFEALFPATGGALYGRANHGSMASFQRPGARTKIKGLYLAGGSVHPGPGVPMAVISGQLAADCLAKDHALMR